MCDIDLFFAHSTFVQVPGLPSILQCNLSPGRERPEQRQNNNSLAGTVPALSRQAATRDGSGGSRLAVLETRRRAARQPHMTMTAGCVTGIAGARRA